MASNDGRVQTQELNLFQPIQPAPLPGSTYVTPQAPPRDNALLQIADSLSSVSQGLGSWAAAQRRQQSLTRGQRQEGRRDRRDERRRQVRQ
jgi:hypothetical protein